MHIEIICNQNVNWSKSKYLNNIYLCYFILNMNVFLTEVLIIEFISNFNISSLDRVLSMNSQDKSGFKSRQSDK